MTITAVVLHPGDTVACLLRDHSAGETPVLAQGTGPTLLDDATLGHKIALVAMPEGTPVVKYGASIGIATADIRPGAHVHLHNLCGSIR